MFKVQQIVYQDTLTDTKTLMQIWKSKTKLKRTSIIRYTHCIKKFLKWLSNYENRPIDEYEFLKIPLEDIYEYVEQFVRLNEIRTDSMDLEEMKLKISPKELNCTYCGIKKWLFINDVINNTKLFKQIDFDKTSTKTSAIDQEVIEIRHLKQAFNILPLDDKVDIGLYSLCALRPQMIHVIKVKDIFPNFIEIRDNHIYLKKPTIVLGRTPNKGNFDFLIVLPTKLSEWIETLLNQKLAKNNIEDVKELKLGNCEKAKCDGQDIRRTTTKLFKLLKLKASPYTLRSLGDTILERLTYVHNDEDLKEFLMNHKGKISSTYGLKGILRSTERQEEILRKYQCVDQWINENIFDMVSDNDKKIAQILVAQAKALNVNEDKIKSIVDILNAGNMDLDAFQKRITEMINDSYTARIEDTVRRILTEKVK